MILSTVLLLALLMIVMTFAGIRRDSQGIFDQMQKDGVALAKSYALSAENALMLHAGLGRLTGEASRTRGIEYLKILDRGSRVIGHTDVSQIGRQDNDPLCRRALKTPITAVEKGKTPITLVDRDSQGREIYRVVIPLVILDSVAGVLEVGLEMTSITGAIARTNNQSLIIATIAMLVGGVCVWLFARSLTRPIKSLVQAAERIAMGDLDSGIRVTTNDEIGHLAESFNYMTGRLREYMGSLKTANAQLEAHANTIDKLRRYTENILASITPGVITTDFAGRITTLNNAGARILQLNVDRAVGQVVNEVLGAGSFSTVLEQALACQREEYGLEVSLVGPDRKEALLIVNTALIRDHEGSPVGLAVTFEDVTEVRQLQKRIAEAEKLAAMGELVVGIAHEVRNPLGAIKTSAQFLQDKFEPADSRYRFARLIVRETERLNQLVERLLSLARPAMNDLQYENINNLVNAAATLAVLKAKEQKIKFIADYGQGLPRLLADARRMQQCFLNIMLNAMDAMPDGGRLLVRTAHGPGDSSVIVEISDTGEGIPEERLDKIFNPFFTTRSTGTGLGLAIVQQIILEHNGVIEVRSRPGEGTTFTIKLPSSAAGFESTSPESLEAEVETLDPFEGRG